MSPLIAADLPRAVRHALDHSQFDVMLEPQTLLTTGELVGFECVLRWHHPSAGTLRPGHFIKAVEKAGFTLSLALEVLERMLDARKALRAAGYNGRLSMNISQQLVEQPFLTLAFAETLQRHGESAKGLVLELTESENIENADAMQRTLQALVAQGFELSLDDFWTGYSSTNKAMLGLFSEVKIDFSLISRIQEDRVALAGVASILSFATNLGLRCIAEGIEGFSTLNHLQLMGCPIGQGYLFSHPLDRAAAVGWYRSYQPRRLTAPGDAPPSSLPPLTTDDLQLLEARPIPVWIFDIEAYGMTWANRAGLAFWRAETVSELQARDFREDAGSGAIERVREYAEKLARKNSLSELWTVYPLGEPRSALCLISGRSADNGHPSWSWRPMRGFRAWRQMP